MGRSMAGLGGTGEGSFLLLPPHPAADAATSQCYRMAQDQVWPRGSPDLPGASAFLFPFTQRGKFTARCKLKCSPYPSAMHSRKCVAGVESRDSQ